MLLAQVSGESWALPSDVLAAPVAGVGIGIGNLGGFAGPFACGAIRTATSSFAIALSLAGLVLIASAVVLLFLRMPGRQPTVAARPAA